MGWNDHVDYAETECLKWRGGTPGSNGTRLANPCGGDFDQGQVSLQRIRLERRYAAA